MKKRITLIALTLILGLFSWSATAQVTVAGSVSGDGSYSTLGAAITAIPLIGQEGNNITIAISASTTEATTGITIGAGTWSSLKIYPTATATISAATPNTSTVAFITLSGANNVTIDGRLDQTGASSLTIVNSSTANSTAGSTIIFDNNAQNNTVKYCTIKGNQTGNFGVISFSATATIANGNGLNIIDHNVITNNAGAPKYGIYAIGNTSFPNTGNQITNNEFKNLLSIYGVSTTVFIAGGATAAQNDNFTISGNSFYQTAMIDNYAASDLLKIMLGIGTSAAPYGGSHTITDNYFGGSAANCVGTLQKRYRQTAFQVVVVYPSGGTTSIQNNTIQNISWSNDYYPSNMIGINIAGGTGNVNIGTVTGNTIGDNTTTGSIVFIAKGTANSSATMINIGTTGIVNCQNNKIGSITAQHQTTGQNINVTAITKNASAGTTNISNNTIGSLTTANSIYSYNTVAPGTTQTVNGITYSSIGTGTVSNNTIANMTNNTTTGNLYAINLNGNGSTTTVNSNLIHSNGITGATTAINYGIWSGLGTNTVTNNIVKLGDNNSYEIRGIGDSGTGNVNIYHNTVYLGGAPTTLALNSACAFSLGTTNTRNYKNNILVNTRSNNGATGMHYALNMTENSGGTIAVDGNDYIASGASGAILGKYGVTDATTLAELQAATGQDAASKILDPLFANAGGTSAQDYKPTITTLVGVSGTGVTLDYESTSRIGATIGAYHVLTTALNTAKSSAVEFIQTMGGQFELKGIEVESAKVFSLQGKLIKSLNNTNTFSINNLPKGIYMLSATDKSGAVYHHKFIL